MTMFELPDAKRVRRDDLLSRESSSPSPSPPPESTSQDGHQRLAELLNFDVDVFAPDQTTGTTNKPEQTKHTESENPETKEGEQGDEDEEQEFEFRLFSAPKPNFNPTPSAPKNQDQKKDESTIGTTQKLRIRLRSPTPGPADLSEGRFVNPFRGWRYYFTTPSLLSGSKSNAVDEDENRDVDADVALKRKQFEEVAVTGEHMLGWARLQPWPGCHLPWRVIHLKRQHTKLPKDSSTPAPAVYVTDPPTITTPKSRKKPGKKRRIQLRKRLTDAEAAKQAEAEKRNRKNRERKMKRRQKAREMKTAAAAAAASGENLDVVMAEADDASSQGGDE